MLCETLLLLVTVAISVSNAGGICISGSFFQSSLNGYYSEYPSMLSPKPSYWKEAEKCGSRGGQSIVYKSHLPYYVVADYQYINTDYFQLKCPNGTIDTPDLCPSGQWQARTGMGSIVTEATVKATKVNSVEDCRVSSGALSQCDTIKITGSGTSSCNTYFSKVRDNLFSNGDKFIYYNTNNNIYGFQTFFCAPADPEETCNKGAFTGTRSTTVSLDNYDGSSLTIPTVDGGSYTLDCNPPTPNPPTPPPTPVSGLCVTRSNGNSDTFGTVGEYIADGTYNGKPRYKSECRNLYILYFAGYGYFIARGPDAESMTTLYSQCTNNIGDLAACSWDNNHLISDSYTECNCSVDAWMKPM